MLNNHLQSSTKRDLPPDSEVLAIKPKRRLHTAGYKLHVLETADELAGKGGGVLNAFLRKEGLYSSHLTQWRKAKAQGLLTDRKRGKTGKVKATLVQENLLLKRRLVAMEKRAKQAEFLVDLQKKMAELLGEAMEPESGTRSV